MSIINSEDQSRGPCTWQDEKSVQRNSTTMPSSPPPPKYIQVDGVMRLNPDYQRWKETDGADSTTYPPSTVSSVALPVVSTMADYSSIHDAILVTDATVVDATAPALADSTIATMEIFQEPEISLAAGFAPTAGEGNTMFDQLTALLAPYEVPIGLINKLMLLEEFEVLEFIIDDSESMTLLSDSVDPHSRDRQRLQTRWQEAQNRLLILMEILSHLPIQTIDVLFLNRSDRITITRNGRDPTSLFHHIRDRIHAVFAVPPSGSTPVRERLDESFQRGRGRAVARYLFCDGAPNGGPPGRRAVVRLLQHRAEPVRNPVTLMSCTDDDAQVEWMKDAEEVVPYCSEYDDYEDERREVLRDQGEALPFTQGFYNIAQLVGAMCPDDLDAMDESVPFTKMTLDNLLGIVHNAATYQHYFSCFLDAQRKRAIQTVVGRRKESDVLKQSFPWRDHYTAFLSTARAQDIPAVQQFQRQLEEMDAAWEKSGAAASLRAASASVDAVEI